MNKRRLITLIGSITLVAVIGVGATLAYFTDSASTENVVTMGQVDIKLTENKVYKDTQTGEWVQQTEKDAITEDGLQFTEIYPGETLPKNPTVTVNSDSANAYIRMKMTVETKETSTISAEDMSLLESNLKQQILQNTKWFYSDGYYYYSDVTKAGETAVLFDRVTIPAEWKNNTAKQSFAIKLKAEAIQANHFTPVTNTQGQITSWGTVSID